MVFVVARKERNVSSCSVVLNPSDQERAWSGVEGTGENWRDESLRLEVR